MKAFKFTIALSALLSSSCAFYHHYGSYYGKIINEETKKPIEGAVVLADYYTWLYASPGGPAIYFCDAQETVRIIKGNLDTIPQCICVQAA